MRYLKEYPITAEEVLDVLEKIPQVNPPGTPPEQLRIGGVSDLIRRGIIEHLSQAKNMLPLLDRLAR